MWDDTNHVFLWKCYYSWASLPNCSVPPSYFLIFINISLFGLQKLYYYFNLEMQNNSNLWSFTSRICDQVGFDTKHNTCSIIHFVCHTHWNEKIFWRSGCFTRNLEVFALTTAILRSLLLSGLCSFDWWCIVVRRLKFWLCLSCCDVLWLLLKTSVHRKFISFSFILEKFAL